MRVVSMLAITSLAASLTGCTVEDPQLDETDQDLAIDRAGYNLVNHNFSGQNLDYSTFLGARLDNTTWTYTSCFDCNFYGATGIGMHATNANLAWSNFYGSNTATSDFSHSNLSYAYFYGADAHNDKFSWANLSYADFTGANLSGAMLWGADLRGANFYGADLRYAVLCHAINIPSLAHANTANMKLHCD